MAVSEYDNTILILFSEASESAEFLVCKSRSCRTLELVVVSTNTQHVTLKSPKMSSDDNKQSNYRLMNVLCRKKLYLLILANLQSNKRQKKETPRFSHRFFAYMHLS